LSRPVRVAAVARAPISISAEGWFAMSENVTEKKKKLGLDALTRRDFLVGSAAAGVGMMLGRSVFAANDISYGYSADPINVGLIGYGEQGAILVDACHRLPGIRFKAICDIWDWNRKKGFGRLRAYGHDANPYEDYREMLDKEKDLHAVLVATPDWMHAEHANACMEAGLNVYCEKEMSNSLEKAKSMVLTARKTGKLLQIGHQRRSNPRYIHAIDRLVHQERMLGDLTHGYGQWNRSLGASQDNVPGRNQEIPDAKLKQYGYESMHQFLNWRWFKKYGGGPIVDLGSHQIDIFSWIFGCNPSALTADGGTDYFPEREWYDNVMAIYEFKLADGRNARAFYQVLTTTSYGGFAESFMGTEGTLQISELPFGGNWFACERDDSLLPKWHEAVKRGLLFGVDLPLEPSEKKDVDVDVRVSPPTPKWPLPVELSQPAHQPHLQNFFDAIRNGTPLNCPAEMGYETAVMVLRANEAVKAGHKLHFRPEDFVV
jgi:predicted dehydrogenase